MRKARNTPGRGFRPLNALLFYLLRLVPFVAARRHVADWVAAFIRGSQPRPAPRSLPALDVLARDGIAPLDPLLTDSQLTDINGFLRDKVLTTEEGALYRLEDLPHGVQRASYPLTTVLACPHLLEALNRPELLQLAEAYLGARPTISAMRIDCTFPGAWVAPVHVQKFHRDYDDWRLIKVFVYLTNTSDPHEYVRTSHLRGAGISSTPSLRSIERTFGTAAIERVVGPMGTTFVADTFGIHRGAVPVTSVRTLFQATLSLRPIPRYAYDPVSMSRAAVLDRHVNRLLVSEPRPSST